MISLFSHLHKNVISRFAFLSIKSNFSSFLTIFKNLSPYLDRIIAAIHFVLGKLQNLLSLATKESYFIFKEVLYKQKDGVAMCSPLGPTLANAFLCFYERKSLEECPSEFKPGFYRRYVDDIPVLFRSTNHLEKLRNYFITCHPNMSFSFETEKKNGKMSFLDVEISRENATFVTTIYRQPTFSGAYTHFESFLPSTHKFSMLYTLVYRCFTLCSDWTKFHRDLVTLKEIFLTNGHPKSFIDKCFKCFLI